MSDAPGTIPPDDDRAFIDWITRIWIGTSQIDECWMERGARGLRWWPFDHAQTLWVEPPRRDGDTLAWRVLVETEIADIAEASKREHRGVLREARLRSARWQHQVPALGSLAVVENRSGTGASFKLVDRVAVRLVAGVDDASLMALLATGMTQLLRAMLIRHELSGADPTFTPTISSRRDGVVRAERDGLYHGCANQVVTLVPPQDLWNLSLGRCSHAVAAIGGRYGALPAILVPKGPYGDAASQASSMRLRQHVENLMCTLPQSEVPNAKTPMLGHAKFVGRVPLKRLPFEPGIPEIAFEVALRETSLGLGCSIRSASPFPQLLDSRASTFSEEFDGPERARVYELLCQGDHRDVPRLAKFAERVRALDHFAVYHETSAADLEAGLAIDGLGGWSLNQEGLVRESFLPAATCVNPEFPAAVLRSHLMAHPWARSRTKKQLDAPPVPHALEHHP